MSLGGMKLPLNSGQQAAADGFLEFLHSDETEMAIRGPAGVGKTFLLGHMADYVMNLYRDECQAKGEPVLYNSIVFTATTNPAADKLSIAMGREANTIYTFMNLRVEDNTFNGTSKVIKTNMWRVHHYLIIVVDEAYTMDSILLNLIHEGTHNCKIIYVGDHCQLGPVKESKCPLIDRPMRTYNLLQPMRNSGSPELMALCSQLRETVETGIFKPIHLSRGVIDLLSDDEMEAELASHFLDKTTDDRILAFTNQRVIAYNSHIRGLRNLPDEYQTGEFLVNNMAFAQGRNRISIEQEVEILDQDDDITLIPIDHDVNLAVRHMKIRAKYAVFDSVPVPVDQEHFKNLKAYFYRIKKYAIYFMLKNTFPDFRPRDASTFHKAQGSTCETVFIDVGDLSRTCHRSDIASRLLYVGVSRPKHRVVFYGKLADKYGGIIQ